MGKATLPYDLTRSAESDLRGIAKTTREKWGKKQAAIYGDKLEQCFYNIAENTLVHRAFSKRFPQVMSVKCEHHYVFYIRSEKERPIIIAVLYEHMDMLKRIINRLSD